jgi:hypothetical protein
VRRDQDKATDGDEAREALIRKVLLLRAAVKEATIRSAQAQAEERERKAELAKVEAELAAVPVGPMRRDTAKLVDDPDRGYVALGGKSIIGRIEDHFRQHAYESFSPADIMLHTGIPVGHVEAVRVAIKRLVAKDIVAHVDRGRYQLHQPPKEHPTSSRTGDCG